MLLDLLLLFPLALIGATQTIFTAIFVRRFRRPSYSKSAERKPLPVAGILLSLRGADDETPLALHRFMSQDYPNYELHIVVDSEQDPAWQVVQEAVRQHPAARVFVEPLKSRPPTCSPHCASLSQAAESAVNCEVLALADGDVVAFPRWLKTLVLALDEEDVGMVHGNRWYFPQDGGWGSLVRYVWNVAAVVAMYVFRIPWGGTSAFRAADMRRAGIIEAWRTTLNQDNPAKVCLERIGKRTKFVPELMMPNCDFISLEVCHEFLARQLTWTRIYNPRLVWFCLVYHGWATMLLQFTILAAVPFGLLIGDEALAWKMGSAAAGYLLLCMVLGTAIEMTVRRVIRAQGAEVRWASSGILLKLPVALMLTQVAYASALWLATTRRRIEWRRVTYEINGPWNNRVVSDLPEKAV